MRFLAFCFILSLLGCATERTGLPTPLDAVMPTGFQTVQAGANAAVLLENLTEDPETDKQTATPIEVIADVLASPWNVAWTLLGAQVAVFWSVGDLLTGHPNPDPERRFEQMKPYLPIRFAAPDYWDHREAYAQALEEMRRLR